MVVGAAVAFYVASHAAGDAVADPGSTIVSPVRHALAQWVSIAWVALVAVWLDHAEIAVGVIFSTAVAALSLHLGVTVASGHDAAAGATGHVADHPIAPSRAWAFVLPTAVLALVVGFAGKLTLFHALLFAVQGVLIGSVWREHAKADASARAPALPATRKMQLALAIVLGAVGAIAAVYGAVRMSQETYIMSTGLIASAALGPLLVLPMIGSASVLASHGQAQTAVGASVVIVLLNLCVLLPIVVAGWHVRQALMPPVAGAATTTTTTTQPATTQSTAGEIVPESLDERLDDEYAVAEAAMVDDFPRVLTFPIAVWRIDTVLLILLGLYLLPVSFGLWEIRKSEGLLLIVVYAAYLIATTLLGRRWG